MMRSWNNCSQAHLSITNLWQFYLYGIICVSVFPDLKKNTPGSCSERGELNIQLSLTGLWVEESATIPTRSAESVPSAAHGSSSQGDIAPRDKPPYVTEVCHPKGDIEARCFLGRKPNEEVRAGERWLVPAFWVFLKGICQYWPRASELLGSLSAKMCLERRPLCHG